MGGRTHRQARPQGATTTAASSLSVSLWPAKREGVRRCSRVHDFDSWLRKVDIISRTNIVSVAKPVTPRRPMVPRGPPVTPPKCRKRQVKENTIER